MYMIEFPIALDGNFCGRNSIDFYTCGCSKNIYFFMWRDVGHTYNTIFMFK